MSGRPLEASAAFIAAAILLGACATVETATTSSTIGFPATTAAMVAITTQPPSCASKDPGTTPPARGYASMVALPDRVLLTGGETAPPPLGGEVLVDTWSLSVSTGWTNLTGCPSPSWGTAAYDRESNRVIVVGFTGEGFSNVREVWAFDPTTSEWSPMAIDGGPEDLGWLAYDAESDRVVMLGPEGETWAYDFNTNSWQEMAPLSMPPGRHEEAIAYDSGGDRVLIFGGYVEGDVTLGDTWAYDYNSDAWVEMTPAVSPAPRAYPAMAYDSVTEKAILYGGEEDKSVLSSGEIPSTYADTWAYDLEQNTWTQLDPPSSPGPRAWHSMAYDNASGQIVLFGGAPIRDPIFQNDTWLYDPASNSWSELP